ncbi:type IV pilus biogenesis protein PilP [Herbaspirillum sp. RV1423]|uniref:type IV pilus biogenesis protein PilP n=1 Tax=Herbaspirillum sp. RV1423 TaxID=1443993 RepID=UPI0004B40369|nr:type IV pilus biogenesis protein PilP [Herbaspirillum sp. RV1423]
MRNKLVIPFAVLAALYGNGAYAESTSDSLTRIEAETLVLKAREKQLEVQANIVGKQNEIAAKQSLTAAITQTTVVGDPVIRAIEGISGRMYATLQLSDGSVVDVQQGDTLASGMKIVSIGPREVVAQSKNNQRVRLATYAQVNSGFNPNFPSSGLSLPVPQLRGAAR